MMTYETAREKEINACIDRLGRDFVMRFRENACSAYGDIEDHAFCFVGISDKQATEDTALLEDWGREH
ncbi:MAG: hypothetical protein IJT16_03215 [Lachnospiraceae bacterium]|nr:hypothetical protein [Lachnospiraceae bacterium]